MQKVICKVNALLLLEEAVSRHHLHKTMFFLLQTKEQSTHPSTRSNRRCKTLKTICASFKKMWSAQRRSSASSRKIRTKKDCLCFNNRMLKKTRMNSRKVILKWMLRSKTPQLTQISQRKISNRSRFPVLHPSKATQGYSVTAWKVYKSVIRISGCLLLLMS